MKINFFTAQIGMSMQTFSNYKKFIEWVPKLWKMLDIQLGRRNLSPIQRIAVAEKYRPIYEKQAKENMSLGGGDKKSGSQNSSTPISPENKIDVRAKLAKTAGVSTDTYSKGKKILDSNNEDLKQEILSGEKSINAGYKELMQCKQEERQVSENRNKTKQSDL